MSVWLLYQNSRLWFRKQISKCSSGGAVTAIYAIQLHCVINLTPVQVEIGKKKEQTGYHEPQNKCSCSYLSMNVGLTLA